MSSNIPWGKLVANSDNTTARNRTVVNTPQTNPASWPQLGASNSEHSETPQEQIQPQDDSHSTLGMSNTPKSESGSNSASAWGRLPDNDSNVTNTSTAANWGAPSTGAAWGHNPQSGVDDGTAVWGKSATTQQHQGKWGGPPHISQANEATTAATGWGAPEQNQQSNNQEGTTTANNQPVSSSQAAGGNQPVTWAKAAAAGLPPSSPAAEAQPAGNEQEGVVAPAPPPPTAAAETDPVRKLVNSHEGWGKKPVQQGTSWNISNSSQGMSRPQSNVSNGTEVWGKASGGQMPPGPGWDDSSNKQSGGWGANLSNPPAPPGANYASPPQQQQQQPQTSFPPGNPSGGSGWGNSQQQSGINNNRWNDMPSQPPNNPSGWGGPPASQPAPGNPSWGNMPSNNENSSWGGGPPVRPASQGAGWGNNMMPPSTDQPNWGRSTDTRRPGTVNDGTSAWGDANTFSNMNMWDKSKGLGNSDNLGGQMPNMNSPLEPKGWGGPPSQLPNRAPSPSNGWGNVSPTRANSFIDSGTSLWGSKNMSGEKWDKGNGAGNWNNGKQNPGMWNQPNDQQWGSTDNGSNWGPQMGKVKSNINSAQCVSTSITILSFYKCLCIVKTFL